MKKNSFLDFILPFLFQISFILAVQTYTNPVIKQDGPDPTVIQANGYYYLYTTGEKIYKSLNLINWTYVGKVFEGKTRPSFVKGVKIYWAPCITKQNDKYILYFALSVWGGEDSAGIGVATSLSPEGPFTIYGKDGKLFTSKEVGVKNSIDPFFIQEGSTKFLIWGSFHGIYAIQLTSDGLSVKNHKVKYQLAGTRFEGSFIYKRNNYYYLFASVGSCCKGDNSTYKTVVGRSSKLLGPYVDKDNHKMIDNHFTVLLSSSDKFVGPGHNSRIIVDKDKKTWMFYHAYIRGQSQLGRTVCMDEVKWTNSQWPYFEGNKPSTKAMVGPHV